MVTGVPVDESFHRLESEVQHWKEFPTKPMTGKSSSFTPYDGRKRGAVKCRVPTAMSQCHQRTVVVFSTENTCQKEAHHLHDTGLRLFAATYSMSMTWIAYNYPQPSIPSVIPNLGPLQLATAVQKNPCSVVNHFTNLFVVEHIHRFIGYGTDMRQEK